MSFSAIIAAIILPVPFFHLWLHALLPWWKKHLHIFYGLCGLMWIGSFFFVKILDRVSIFAFFPSIDLKRFGYFLMILGAFAVSVAIMTLGAKRFFMWAVLRPESAPRIRIHKSLYNLFPHPAYIGHITIALGNFLSNGKLYLGLISVALFILMPIVIYFEEEELRRRVGQGT